MEADGQDTWDRAAGSYARQEWLQRRAVGRAVELLAPAGGETLLDVATGTGIVPRTLAVSTPAPAEVVGLDRSSGMLARVGELPAGWRTVQADATELPFPAARFDLAVCSYALHLLGPADRQAVLAELTRVLRPGGRLVTVTVWSPRAAVRGVLEGLARSAPGGFGGLMPMDPRPELEAAGLALLRAQVLHRGYPSLVVLARRPRAPVRRREPPTAAQGETPPS